MLYFSAPELRSLLSQYDFDIEILGDAPVHSGSLKDKLISIVRRMAIGLKLIPKTMKGKETFKRLFYGQLLVLKEEIEEGMTDYCAPVPIDGDFPNHDYKVLFAIARFQGG